MKGLYGALRARITLLSAKRGARRAVRDRKLVEFERERIFITACAAQGFVSVIDDRLL